MYIRKGWGSKFRTVKCRKANITRVAKIWNKKWSYEIKYQRANIRIDEIVSNAKCRRRTISKLDNFLRIFVIFKVLSFLNLTIFKILKFRRFRKLSNCHTWNFLIYKFIKFIIKKTIEKFKKYHILKTIKKLERENLKSRIWVSK